MYIKTTNGAYEKPYSIGQLRKDNPNTSFPKYPTDALLAEWGVYPVQSAPKPDYNPSTQKVIEGHPINQAGSWVQTWQVVPLSADEIAERLKNLQDSIISGTQQRLDQFAQARNYDGILSLCTYATSANPKFKPEGAYGVQARDQTWAKLYEILAEVETGVRPVPAGYADIEPELPPLVWSE
jgi:hypothetical protein